MNTEELTENDKRLIECAKNIGYEEYYKVENLIPLAETKACKEILEKEALDLYSFFRSNYDEFPEDFYGDYENEEYDEDYDDDDKEDRDEDSDE